MGELACPESTMEQVIAHPETWECVTCGFEWRKESKAEIAQPKRF
jgi:Zn ribbon nucleic-acid-binding protein